MVSTVFPFSEVLSFHQWLLQKYCFQIECYQSPIYLKLWFAKEFLSITKFSKTNLFSSGELRDLMVSSASSYDACLICFNVCWLIGGRDMEVNWLGGNRVSSQLLSESDVWGSQVLHNIVSLLLKELQNLMLANWQAMTPRTTTVPYCSTTYYELLQRGVFRRGTVHLSRRFLPKYVMFTKAEARRPNARGSSKVAVNAKFGLVAAGWLDGNPVHIIWSADTGRISECVEKLETREFQWQPQKSYSKLQQGHGWRGSPRPISVKILHVQVSRIQEILR